MADKRGDVVEMDASERSRTVVVSGVPKVLPVDRMIDKLTVHFQRRRRSHGGDVEVVRYPTHLDGVAYVTFDKPADAERAALKEEQIMMDDEFPADYLLTVFPLTSDVSLYVSRAQVDLSLFGSDQAFLIQSLRSAHRSLHFLPLLQVRKATVEGPLTAVQALRDDLIRRANLLQSQTAAVQTPETPLNPEVISHGGVGSCAKANPANSLSTRLQTTGEVKSPSLKTQTPNGSSRQKVQERGSAEGRFCDTDVDGAKQNSQSRVNAAAASRRSPEVFKQQAEEKLQEENNVQKHTTPDGTKRMQKENHLDSRCVNTGYQKESDRRSSATAAGFKDDSNSSGRNTEETVWVDSNTLQYIRKFEKEKLDKCLRDVTSEFSEGSDLVRVILSGRQTSKATTVIQTALEEFQTLMEASATTLRVHEIDLGEEERRQKQEVIRICDEVNDLIDDVLYMFEGSRIKIIGPSSSSYLFCSYAKGRISHLRYK
ncbi:uncharacterized protein si:dkey-154b15.1 [Labrus mixtus]|uniref:uncharacterized protein si:dkey-154b15.1 n=1 Tax=Labrus mixtus TaxID=508554 RepID=UPI0029BFD0FE|nr:uncharacterized protein si:dkey-154b15.1 [Labrus mixtus]